MKLYINFEIERFELSLKHLFIKCMLALPFGHISKNYKKYIVLFSIK